MAQPQSHTARQGAYVDVGSVEDFGEGRPRIVEVGGREIGVVRWREELFALRNICPHQYGPMCRGHTMPLLTGDADEGTIAADEDRPVVVCPWHGWEFDARTGRAAWGPSTYRIKTYPVVVEDGRVLVDAGRAPRGKGAGASDAKAPPASGAEAKGAAASGPAAREPSSSG